MKKEKVLIICRDTKTEKGLNELFARSAEMLESLDTFCESVTKLDENSGTLAEQLSEELEPFILSLIRIYPNPAQIAADLETFKLSVMANVRKKGN